MTDKPTPREPKAKPPPPRPDHSLIGYIERSNQPRAVAKLDEPGRTDTT